MKYVNPELFMNFDNIKNDNVVDGDFVWLLLAAADGDAGDIIIANNDKELNILKKSVVGFATTSSEAISINKTGPGGINLTIAGSGGTGNILYIIGSQASPELSGFPAKALALVKTKCSFAGANGSTDAIVQEFIREGYYGWTRPTEDDQLGEFVPEYNGNDVNSDILDNIIVVAAYDVSGNNTPINNYNFSGFTVSASNVEITGLYA
jgi:hypothetical protein